MSPFRRLVHALVPFRTRRFLGITLFKARPEWLASRTRSVSRLPPAPPIPPPLVPPDDSAAPLAFPRSTRPRVSIVVPAHNAWAHTHLCLRAMLEHTASPSYEVILADDASTDDTVRASELLHGVTVVREGVQRGFVENCNHAARVARGDYLMFLNNDTVVQPGWLEELVATGDNDPQIAIVGGKVLAEDGRLQEAGCVVFRDGTPAQFGRGGHPVDPAFNYVKEVDYVSGCCLLVRRQVWEQLGGFDELFSPGYFEDVDLAFRARAAGKRVVYQPRAAVMHVEGISHGRDEDSELKRRFMRINGERFRERWSELLAADQADPGDLYVARDRSGRRVSVLVVDHEVPQPDRDAGSKFVATYVRLLVELGYHVVFMSDSLHPAEPYVGALQQAGVEVVYGLPTREACTDWLRKHGRYFDIAYLHRPFVASRYLDGLREHSLAKLIYSPVDMHFVRERRRWHVTGDGDASEQAISFERDELTLLRKADVIHVVSDYEETLVRELVPDATVRTIPLYAYDEPYRDPPPYDARRHVLFVGGFMHLPNVDGARWFAEEVFPYLRDHDPGMFAFLVGSNPPPGLMELAGDGVIVTGQVSERMLESLYEQTRVVVCPLRYGAGAKGKLVEALHYGVPAVVTPIAAEGFPDLDEHVAIAETAGGLAHAILELYDDPRLWQSRSQAALNYAERHFSREAALRALEPDFGLQHAKLGSSANGGTADVPEGTPVVPDRIRFQER